MVKCEVIKEFTLKKFKELKNLKRKKIEKDGKLNTGDIFECTEEMVEYLTGNNPKNEQVVRIIEVLPEEEKKENAEIIKTEEIKKEKQKKTTSKKKKEEK